MLQFGEQFEAKWKQNKMINHVEIKFIKMNLINLNGKCGQIEKAERIFNQNDYRHSGLSHIAGAQILIVV